MGNPTKTNAWRMLETLSSDEIIQKTDISASSIIARDDDLTVSLDLSHSMISDDIFGELFNLAQEQNVVPWRDKMMANEVVNTTENRSVGHMVLRSGTDDGVESVLQKMQKFCDRTHADNKFTDVVHIGIGGSDLGPRLVCDALKNLPQKMNVHFVANVDAADIEDVLKSLNPATTLFVIASKTFTTQETMMNAAFAKLWLKDQPISDHMIALSTNETAVMEFGINPDNMFPFWDWVGGRFSVWSAIGMPIALTYGFDVFQEFLGGARVMDNHFCAKPLDENLPVILALYGVWNRNFMARSSLAVLPYAQNLALLPNFLQQLDMESNGKSVDRDGAFITDYKTGPIVFGQAGTNGQHAFHQWLHQGTDVVPNEIITVKNTSYDNDHQVVLNAHARAQAQAFLEGDESPSDNHKHYAGGRPSIIIQMDNLSPCSLGQLMALYEHKVFVQGILWNINSFDQFGVELGKRLVKKILA